MPRCLHCLIVPAPSGVPSPPSHDVPEVGPISLSCIQRLKWTKTEKESEKEKATVFLCHGAPKGSVQQLVLISGSISESQRRSILLFPGRDIPSPCPPDPRQDQEPYPYFPVLTPTAISVLLTDAGLFVDDTCWSTKKNKSWSVSPIYCLRNQTLRASSLTSICDPAVIQQTLAYIVTNYCFYHKPSSRR